RSGGWSDPVGGPPASHQERRAGSSATAAVVGCGPQGTGATCAVDLIHRLMSTAVENRFSRKFCESGPAVGGTPGGVVFGPGSTRCLFRSFLLLGSWS